ncbi:MAG: ribosome maturation factor RimM [Chloroflexota bacterium]
MSHDSKDAPSTPGRGRTPTGHEVRFLVIGRILGPVGLSGEVRVQILTDFPDRFLQLHTVHLGDNLRPYQVEDARLDRGSAVLKLSGSDDATVAATFTDQDVQIPISEAVELAPDQYFWHQIVGIEVWTDTGRDLGPITEVLQTGSNDVYVVGRGADEILIPAIADVVREIDVAARRMTVHLLPGLEDQRP